MINLTYDEQGTNGHGARTQGLNRYGVESQTAGENKVADHFDHRQGCARRRASG